MPREIRKRGKKKSKAKEEQQEHVLVPATLEPGPQQEAGPSWMRNPSTESSKGAEELEAPFGYLDADVKAYFRTVDLRLREWQDGTVQDLPEGVDTNEGESHPTEISISF